MFPAGVLAGFPITTMVAAMDPLGAGPVEPFVDTQPVKINAEQAIAPANFSRRPIKSS
jgi:hypothetical protein